MRKRPADNPSARFAPGQAMVDLGPFSLISLLLLFLLPCATLSLFGVKWNPQRSRLAEYDR